MRRFSSLRLVAALALGVVGLASFAHADSFTPSVITYTAPVDTSSLATMVLTYGGGGLAAALGVGLGFKITKKVYSWMTSKM